MPIRTVEEARAWRAQLDKALPAVPDKEASACADLYPVMRYDGKLIPYKTRINWNGALKMAALDIYDTEENNPDNAPALWTDINYRNGARVIPETFTAADAFALDELGWWKGDIYKSLLNSNVYTPEQYAAGWELQEN